MNWPAFFAGFPGGMQQGQQNMFKNMQSAYGLQQQMQQQQLYRMLGNMGGAGGQGGQGGDALGQGLSMFGGMGGSGGMSPYAAMGLYGLPFDMASGFGGGAGAGAGAAGAGASGGFNNPFAQFMGLFGGGF